ncbi:MAG: hypothetical protein JSU74_13655 [Candidatus Zixiibacteriota bacterium]|nr:MAG: hypothetical protein JSU74_13655 [candidate division Zixibacteria bacterium]
MRGIARDCVVEMFARKMFWIFAVITVIAIIVIILSGNVEIGGTISGGQRMDVEDINEMLGNPIMRVYCSFVSFLVILTVLATAGIVPGMLIQGRAEYFLSKPISRTSFLLYKFFGMWLSYGILILICGGLGYGVMYLVHGVTADSMFFLFGLNLTSLFIWLSITVFAGVVFGSGTMAIITAALVWFAQWLLQWHDYYRDVIDSEAVTGFIDVLYYIVPKTGELSDLTVRLALGRPVGDWLPLYSSLIFALVVLVAAVVIFNRKNY